MKAKIIYIVVINVIGIMIMGMDKWKAKHHRYRIPEKILFFVSVIGGSLGTWLGMYLFHHKTKHWYFVIGMPLIFILHIIVILNVFGS